METMKRLFREVLTGKPDLPKIIIDNKMIVRVSIRVNRALENWKWIHRDDNKLNAEIAAIRKEFGL